MLMVCRAPPAEEGVSRPVHQGGHFGGPGCDRQGTRVDAPRIEEVADEVLHVFGLLVDDAVELALLGGIQFPRRRKQGRGRALDRGQRCPQFVAHHAQELGPLPFQFFQRFQVLHGDHQGNDPAVPAADRRGVDQGPQTPAVRHREHEFLGAHGLRSAQRPRERKLRERELLAVRPPNRDRPQQLLRRAARRIQARNHPLPLAVEPHERAGLRLEHRHAHGRGVDQGFQIGASPALVAIRLGVGDSRRRLRCEQDQGFLVLVAEPLSALLVGEIEVADVHAPVTNGRPQEAPAQNRRGGDAEPVEVGRQVVDPQRPRTLQQVPPQALTLGQVPELPPLLGRQAGGDEVADLFDTVDGRDGRVRGAGQHPGAVDHLAQDRFEVEALADAQARSAQQGHAFAPPRDFLSQFVVVAQSSSSGGLASRQAQPPTLKHKGAVVAERHVIAMLVPLSTTLKPLYAR